MKKHLVLKSSVLSVFAGFSMLVTGVQADQVDVQLLGVNDFHGALDTTGSAYMPEGKVANAGTAAQLDAYMDDAETEFKQASPEGTSIRVQAGDMVGASPANSGLLQDEPTVKVFNKMGFEYGTLGNHEFDEGLAEFNRIMTGQAPAADSTINDITKNYEHEASKQTIVIANVVDKESNKIPYDWKPYAVKDVPVNDKSVKVGFIGIVTTEIPNLVLKQNYEQYKFLDAAETIVKYAKELQGQNVNAIVVLAHIPATSKDGVVDNEVATIMEKVNQLYPNHSVDIVFAGHNHQYTNGTVGKTRVVQAVSQGKAYADVRGTLDTDTNDFVATPEAKVIAVAPGVKTGSADIKAIVDQANEIVKTVTERKIGTASTSSTIPKMENNDKESPVGNLVTTAQLAIAKKTFPNVDFAMTNNGGIRADLVVKDDQTITWGAAQAVQPFGNILQVVQITGQQIYDVLNQQYDEGQKYFLQMSGLKYTYTDNEAKNPEVPFKVVKVYKDNGEELDLAANYTLVVNDFLYGGGDGFSVFKSAKLIGAINPDTEVFIEYIKDLEAAGKPVSATVKGVKTYVTSTLEGSTKTDDTGKHDIISRIFRDRAGNILSTEIVSDLVTPAVKADEKKLTTPKQAEELAAKSKTANASLPMAGSNQSSSTLMMILGFLTLGGAGLLKKKDRN
ncbi:surface-anchored 5'-nucleotidase [Streptococcus dysgalactiae]|uniref:surface-anchored 5'-nucleotidase n=1 Tax=Streptococcus dysgalactiae TaxID=1334 RepID=UPI0022B6CDB9|nr:bifunctional metallophosphatase/5'-nucleotidase [Streptococcus dysgalactiae]MDO5365294.1 bifunctional metallophosphatase/5'-nucleotidase [Streptococcus dysgalactiae]